MHRNYFLFERQIQSIKKKLIASVISDCFTYRKDELVISFNSGEDYFLRIGLNAQAPYILLDKAHGIRDPRTRFFKELINKDIINISITPYDKIVDIQFNAFILKCVFFGRDRNVILVDSNNSIIYSFKKTDTNEYLGFVDSADEILPPLDLVKFNREEINQDLSSFIMKRVGGFNKLLSEELCFRANLDPFVKLSEINNIQWKIFNQSIAKIMDELQEEDYFIYERKANNPILSLVELNHIPDGYVKKNDQDINATWKQFIYLYQHKNNLERILNRSREKINRRIKYLEKTLKKVSDFNVLEEKKKISELKGHLLQTFSSEVKKGMDQIKLQNIYALENEYISIQLNPKLSVQENALRYFNKYKDIAEQKKRLKFKQDTYKDELNYWKKKYHETKKIDNLKKAEKLEQILSQKKLIQREGISKKTDSVIDYSAFNRLLLKEKWEIFIGKNAENNDLLTFKFARKYDIWLHAQGVPGSHVIIRVQDKNQRPPREIIEQAASIAAFFSGAKNSSTVAVNYTEVRYVRKPRKTAPGTAIITNAKTIFVEPKKYI